MRYGCLWSGYWQWVKDKGAGDDAIIFGAYALSCEHGNALGSFRLPLTYIEEDLAWPVVRVMPAIREMCGYGLVAYLEPWMVVRDHLQWNKPKNPNMARGLASLYGSLPGEIALISAVDAIRCAGPELDRFREDFAARLRNCSETVTTTVPKQLQARFNGSSLSRFANCSETVLERVGEPQAEQSRAEHPDPERAQTPKGGPPGVPPVTLSLPLDSVLPPGLAPSEAAARSAVRMAVVVASSQASDPDLGDPQRSSDPAREGVAGNGGARVLPAAVDRVLDEYADLAHPYGKQRPKAQAIRDKVRLRIGEYGEEAVIVGVRNLFASDYHTGRDGKAPKLYIDIMQVIRSAPQLERWRDEGPHRVAGAPLPLRRPGREHPMVGIVRDASAILRRMEGDEP